MRLRYVSKQPSHSGISDDEIDKILTRIHTRRGKYGLLPLDLTLLHSPTVADAWHTFFAAINATSSLTDDIRELAICRVAFVNESWYQWDGHKEALLKCDGFRLEQMESIQALKPEGQGFLTDKQWAVLRYADAMTSNVRVETHLFQELKNAGFYEREMVDLTVTIAAYNCVSRFLVALDVGEKNSAGP